MRATRVRWSWAGLSTLCAVTFVWGCNTPSNTSRASNAPSDAPARTAGGDRHDSCSLHDPEEVEAVLGAPLDTPPFRWGGGPVMANTGGDNSVYETAHVHYIQIEIDFEGGAQA